MELTNPFKDKLYRLAKRLLISHEEAQDATQEILVRLWDRRESLKEYQSIEALAMRMVRNFSLDQLKSKRVGHLQVVEHPVADSDVGMQRRLEDADTMEWVARIINCLPEQQRSIIQMRDVEQYEFAHIAEVLEMNETAVRVALSRARKTIREHIIKAHSYGLS